jgi:hypothetical protein
MSRPRIASFQRLSKKKATRPLEPARLARIVPGIQQLEDAHEMVSCEGLRNSIVDGFDC